MRIVIENNNNKNRIIRIEQLKSLLLYEVSTIFKRPLMRKCKLNICLEKSSDHATNIETRNILKKKNNNNNSITPPPPQMLLHHIFPYTCYLFSNNGFHFCSKCFRFFGLLRLIYFSIFFIL